jgi:myo-inositol-1(or 4)-monophosphatase
MKISDELSTAIRAAKAAGQIQLRHFGKPMKKTMKVGMDFATHVDYECEKAVLDILRADFPDYGILSEEIGEIKAESDYRWIVDPLDGTLPYARGLSSFGALVSLQNKDSIELGVIYRPLQNELIFAQRKKGAFHNGQHAAVSKVKSLAESSISYQDVRYPARVCPQGFSDLLSKAGLVLGMP